MADEDYTNKYRWYKERKKLISTGYDILQTKNDIKCITIASLIIVLVRIKTMSKSQVGNHATQLLKKLNIGKVMSQELKVAISTEHELQKCDFI